VVIVGFSLLVRRSGAAFVRTALLKQEVAQSRQRVRHKLRLLLLRSQHQPHHDAQRPDKRDDYESAPLVPDGR